MKMKRHTLTAITVIAFGSFPLAVIVGALYAAFFA